MPGIVTRRFRVHNAEQFHEAFSESSGTSMYLYIARVSPWDDDNSPPTPSDSVQQTEYDSWKKMLAAKKLQGSDVTFAVPRYNWVNNTVYREYNTTSTTLWDDPASSNTFYVVNNQYNVYKCLFNNKGVSSTVEPTGTSTATLATADGYQWKFMYTIDAAASLKFLTEDFIPIKTLTADDGSAQFDVQATTANGSIDVIDVTVSGNSYMNDSGTLAAAAANTVTLATSANTSDNIYNGSALYVSSGLGAGQVREIIDYVGTTKVARLKTNFTITPNTASTYIVSPLITISGDGTGALAYCNVDTTTSNSVNYVNMISTGSNYSEATVTITGNTSHGSGATATAFVAPPGGHGSDPVGEFAAHNVILNVQLDGGESNTFPTVNDYRTIGLIRDPLVANGSVAVGPRYNQTTRLTVSSVSGTGAYTLDETVRGGTSGAAGKIVSFANTNTSNTAGILTITDSASNGSFTLTETLTGLSSNITAVLDTITLPQTDNLVPYTGDHIYIENRVPVSRAADQIEDIKIVVKF